MDDRISESRYDEEVEAKFAHLFSPLLAELDDTNLLRGHLIC